MFSRAHLLIQREYEKLQELKPWGIDAHPLKDDNMFEWTARILGLQNSQWEGGIFRLYIKFDENFNYRPPEICFHTIPFHPNVDMITGRPCIDFLDDENQWNPNFSLSLILLTVQAMLSNPVLENAVNTEAIYLMTTLPHAYNQMVQECILNSQRLQSGNIRMTAEAQPATKVEIFKPSPGASHQKVAKIAFEDYYNTWKYIATSKSEPSDKNLLLLKLKEDPALQSQHYGLPPDVLQYQLNKQIDEHNTLIYGKFKINAPKNEEKQARLDQVNQMKKIYLQQRTPRQMPMTTGGKNQENQDDKEPWEKDVDDLVAWTNNLDLDKL